MERGGRSEERKGPVGTSAEKKKGDFSFGPRDGGGGAGGRETSRDGKICGGGGESWFTPREVGNTKRRRNRGWRDPEGYNQRVGGKKDIKRRNP